jgi:hypothetical protein
LKEAGEMQTGIMAGNRCIGALHRTIKSKNISEIYQRCVNQDLRDSDARQRSYTHAKRGSLIRQKKTKLEVWERKVLRKIFGREKRGDR